MNPLSVLPSTPLQLITIDFETYYADDYTLSKSTTDEYITDPRFEVIGVGVATNDLPAVWMSNEEFTAWKYSINWAASAVLCHHTHFDGRILEHHFGVRPGFWLDTLSMSRALHSPIEVGGSLAALALKYGVGEKGHEVVLAKNKRLGHFTREEWLQYGEYCKNDVNLTRAIFKLMLPHFPEGEAWLIDATIRMFTQPVFEIDGPVLEAALKEELERKSGLLSKLENGGKEQLLSNPKFAALLEEYGVEPPTKISPKTGKETFAFAKSDPGMKALLDSPVDEVRWLAEARIGIKSTIAESRISRFIRMGHRGPAPVNLRYAAAHTKRWGGSDKTNFQNLPRSTKLRPSALRHCLTAPAGQVIVACDSGQIEARGVAWLAGHEGLLQAFREKRDVYSELATEVYGRPIDRKKNPDKVPGDVGKVGILGLGYGMGWKKFSTTLLAGPMGADPIQFTHADAETMGVDVMNFAAEHGAAVHEIVSRLSDADLVVHCAVAKHVVDKYRRVNPQIPTLWRFMERVIIAMAEGVRMEFGPQGVFHTVRHGIMLPNGLIQRYPGLSNDGDGWSYMGGAVGKERKRLYGGSLTENLTQGFCRNIVADQMLYLWGKYGYRPLLMTHDEIVFCCPEEEGPVAIQRAIEVMKMSPDWCPEIPLNAEGGFAKTYGACK